MWGYDGRGSFHECIVFHPFGHLDNVHRVVYGVVDLKDASDVNLFVWKKICIIASLLSVENDSCAVRNVMFGATRCWIKE